MSRSLCVSLALSLPLSFPLSLSLVLQTEAVVNDSSGENKAGAADVSASQHVMVCALKELGSLVQSLSATSSPIIQEPSIGTPQTCQSMHTHTNTHANKLHACYTHLTVSVTPESLHRYA